MWAGLWQKRCKFSETATAIAYEQHGFFEQVMPPGDSWWLSFPPGTCCLVECSCHLLKSSEPRTSVDSASLLDPSYTVLSAHEDPLKSCYMPYMV